MPSYAAYRWDLRLGMLKIQIAVSIILFISIGRCKCDNYQNNKYVSFHNMLFFSNTKQEFFASISIISSAEC